MAKKNRVHVTRTQIESSTIAYGGANPFEIVLARENAKIRFKISSIDNITTTSEKVEIVLTKAGLQALIDEAGKFLNPKTDFNEHS
jgi:hypothetical protein